MVQLTQLNKVGIMPAPQPVPLGGACGSSGGERGQGNALFYFAYLVKNFN